MYRTKEIKNGVVVQQRTFRWFWFTISDPLPRDIAEALVIILSYPKRVRKLKKDYNKLVLRHRKILGNWN